MVWKGKPLNSFFTAAGISIPWTSISPPTILVLKLPAVVVIIVIWGGSGDNLSSVTPLRFKTARFEYKPVLYFHKFVSVFISPDGVSDFPPSSESSNRFTAEPVANILPRNSAFTLPYKLLPVTYALLGGSVFFWAIVVEVADTVGFL